MKSCLAALFAAVLYSAASATPAHAITYGVRDNGEHPYVGFMLLYDGVEQDWFSCTGTLLGPTTFVTAGHCTFGIATDSAETPGGSGGNDVWVSFDEAPDLSTFPRRADYPDDMPGLYAARSEWLNGNAHFTRGTSHPHPSYDGFLEFPNDHDVGVVVLGAPAAVTSFADLADVGALDAIALKGKGHNSILIETAGYGIQEVRPNPLELDERWKSTSRIVNLKSHLTGDFNLETSNNPSPSGGQGGSCFGDSGGGLFLSDTNVLVAIVSFGQNDNCKGVDYSARADTADVQDFLHSFLSDAATSEPNVTSTAHHR
jgi:hypothetical protein